ncbi:lipopolysaccharide assembly protein LapA domain-containing protein [Plebeiibacterium marinum]|uniref:Lipopolysaccharide assembly protein LapA domain-containing protein n=1 Tax=Plebeiibacterium marinum TaxID=2992111 RepID=A0AAE3MBQ3_9BACT|nr:lipopolysaccharide assembly protein LapA domain-containing protein [Plebeiobacterium marinum]MCW3804197.1 lipopolysaccharide assembly protein LapA domain-containing protein [Plebeiobacterium marinum]
MKSLWFLIILAFFVVVFSVQNAEVVPIKFVIWEGEVSLAILLILTFLLGLIVGAIYYAVRIRKSKKNLNPVGDVAFEKEEQSDIEGDKKGGVDETY